MTIMAAVRDVVGRVEILGGARERARSALVRTFQWADGDRRGSGRALAVNIFGVSVLSAAANRPGRQETPIWPVPRAVRPLRPTGLRSLLSART
jgi:hypothetical protein